MGRYFFFIEDKKLHWLVYQKKKYPWKITDISVIKLFGYLYNIRFINIMEYDRISINSHIRKYLISL